MSLNLDKSNWEIVRFGEVVKHLNETVRDAAAAGIDRVIGLEHLDPGLLETARWGDDPSSTTFTKRVRPGQTLFGKRRAYQRKAAYAEFDAVTSGDILTFEAVPGRLAPELLPFLVHSEPFFANALETSAGSLSPRTNWRDLAKFEFTLPSLPEQRRLADVLWTAEHHRRALVDASETLSMARERSFDLSLDAGLATDGWRLVPIPELVTSGPTNGKSAPANDEGRGLPTLSISAIRRGKVLAGDSVKYVDIPRAEVASFILEDGDFLVVRGNGNRDLTGRGGLVVGGMPADCFYPDLLIRLRFDTTVVHRDFAAQQWNSGRAHAALIKKAKSTNGIWKINGQDIKSHELIVPPLRAQLALLDTLGEYDQAIQSVSSEAESLASLRSAIMGEVFG